MSKKKEPYVRQPKLVKSWIGDIAKGCPVREFKPLKAQPHPRQAEMDAYRATPSWHP